MSVLCSTLTHVCCFQTLHTDVQPCFLTGSNPFHYRIDTSQFGPASVPRPIRSAAALIDHQDTREGMEVLANPALTYKCLLKNSRAVW